MSLPIRWSERSLASLDAIVEYIALRNGVAAFALRDRIEAAVLPLSEHPYLFRAGRVAGTREIVAHPNYIVVYQVLEREVIISDVLHARQRYP